MTITLRPIEAGDFEEWRQLFRGYLEFYQSEVADDVVRHSFDVMVDKDGGIDCTVALGDGGALVGFVTYLFHPVTWHKGPRCYLEDLFTSPDARGKGVARALIAHVNARAREAGADQVYWMTQEFNYAGRMLYDKVAKRTPFIKYQQSLT